MIADYSRRVPVWNRLLARFRSEVPAGQLEAFRRAGAGVFEVCLLAEERRAHLRAAAVHPWDAPADTASLFLATWNARIHQELGTELLDADYRETPRTAGFLPPVTARQAWLFFQPVETWLSLARRAMANSDFWIGDQVELPSGLPRLLRPRGAPHKHLRGLLTAADAVNGILEESLGAVLGAGEPPGRWAEHHQRIAELAAQAQSSLRYAQALWHPTTTPQLDAIILRHLEAALELEHHVGQFLALPELVDRYRRTAGPTPARRPHTHS